MFYLHYIPDGASSKLSSNYKLSQLIKPTNTSKGKMRNKTSTLPTKQDHTPSSPTLKQNKIQQNTQRLNETNKNPKLKENHTLKPQRSQLEH